MSDVYLVTRDDGEYEQVILCELLVPDVPNSFGDIYTRESIREFAYEYARQGYGIDIDHSEEDVRNKDLVVVESFIARPGDPNFIEGSWVVGMKVLSDDVWQQVLDGELNGFSFQAECLMTPITITNLRNRQVSGVTEPDPVDGHAHTFLVLLNALNKPISGGTGTTNGHSHRISVHTQTARAIDASGREHLHRYQVIVAEDEGDDDGAGT